ncbi:tonsoku-like protein [Hylaeus anthracinus]|uniref:tonsoku-like protein n=1 Tax=Hylaeus anthracinus TaxID=313031 RepID=UPI0023BA0E14|nr:tonsoku-like protein [Hylaeus anthracinus]
MDTERLLKKKKRVKRDGNLQQWAEVVKELGDLYFETGKLEDALQEYTEQLEVCSILEDKLNIAVAHRMIGEIHADRGNYEEALKYQNHYLEGAKEINNLLEEQRAYATLGRTYFCWAESLPEKSEKKTEVLINAKKAYVKSIRLCNKLGDTDIDLKELITMRARLLLNLGLVLETQKEHQQAVDLMEKAAALCETHNLQEDFHRTQIALGGIYDRQRNYDSALKHFETATEVDNPSLKAEAQLLQGELLLRMERWSESRKILVSLYVTDNLPQNVKNQVEKTLRIVATLNATEEALKTEESISGRLKLYENLGDAAVAVHCFEKAIDYYRKMLKCAEEIKSDRIDAALLSLAQTLKDVGRYNEALDFAHRELKLCTDSREICRSALFLADLLVATKATDDQIQEIYDLAWNNAKVCADVSLEASVLKEQLNYFINSGKTEDIKMIQEKLDMLEEASNCSDSEDELEENDIGANICLEDLSDVETELRAKENGRINRKRTKRKLVTIKKNEKGETLLHVACINGNIEAVEKLLVDGHPLDVRDNFGWTPLHEAANHGFVEIAKLLLQHGANVNDPGSIMCQGVTPLHDAASCGNLSMMRLLMEHGANVELVANEDDTVLDCLEQWKDRVDYLSSDDEADYNEMHKRLSALIPANKRKKCKQSNKSSRSLKSLIDDRNSNVEKVSAGEDYKRTIASLKHRSDPIGATLTRAKRIVNPLLNNEEVLLDDWLEDDINESISDKRCSDERNVTLTIKRKSSNGDIDQEQNLKRQRTKIQSPIVNDEELDLTEEESNDSSNTEIINSFEVRKFRKKKQQMSLLSIGFTKDPVSRTPSPVNSSPAEFDLKEADLIIKSIILNVSIEGKVFQTQAELSNTSKPSVQNILTDIEKKFYDDSGCRAKLDLKTMNGITINSNNVFTILNEGDIIKNFKCEVIELETPSIVERYRTICTTHNIDVREFISKCLKSCENTLILRLKQDISKKELVCVLKTLEYQKNVQILDMSNKELHEAGDILNDCILKLSTLQELCLQGCDIDSMCLSKLQKLPSQLKFLDLSYNPLGSASEEALCKLIIPLTQLQTLNLRYCQLPNIRFLSSNSTLVNLDVSWNNLNGNELCSSLQRQLLNLNLSCTAVSTKFNLVKSIFNNTNVSFTNLECLELVECDLLDSNVRNILSQASNLSKLVLRGNRDVGSQSLNFLLNHTPTLRHIDISGCETIATYPDTEVFIENPEVCTLISSMSSDVYECWVCLWRRKGIARRLSHNLVIVKPMTY